MAISPLPRLDRPASYEEARERWLRLQSEANAAHADMLDWLARRQDQVEALSRGEQKKLLVTVDEAANMLDCSRPTVYDLVRSSRGQLRFVKVGSRTKLRLADVRAYVEGL